MIVAAVAILGGCLAAGIGIGPWEGPYQLRSVGGIVNRFGKPAARFAWLVIALVSLIAGIAIANGVRPSYARPGASQLETAQ